MIELLITILVICLIAYLAFWAIGQLSLPDPIKTVVVVVIVIILILVLVNLLGVGDLRLTGKG